MMSFMQCEEGENVVCSECGAKTVPYNEAFLEKTGLPQAEIVDKMYSIRISNFTAYLCPRCVEKLKNKIIREVVE